MSKFTALALALAFTLSPVVVYAQTATTKPAAPAAQAKVDCTKTENKAKDECKTPAKK